MPLPVTSVVTVQDPTCTCVALACPGYIEGNGAAFNGPQRFNGALYHFGRRLNEAVTPAKACVMKSIDDGATWTVMNEAAAPQMRSNGTPVPISPAVFDAARGFLHICYQDQNAPSHLFYVRFDMNTDTYGAPVDSGLVWSNKAASSRICLRSDGSCVLFYPQGAGLNYKTITAGVFGAATALVAVGVQVWACAADGADKIYIAYGPNTVTTSMVTLTAGGVVSAPSAIAALGPSAASWMLLWNNRILIPYTTPFNAGNLDASNKAAFFEGTPISDTPVWSSHDIHDGLPTTLPDGSIVRDRGPLVVQFDASTVYFAFSLEAYDTPLPDSIVSLYTVTYDGVTIGAPVLIWDEIANPAPCATGLNDDDILMLGASAIFEGSTLRFLVYASANQDLQQSSTLVDAVFGAALAITCDNPPIATVGVAYSHFFPATGGTPPYTFSIAAGALPPGLTLDAATGEVSGIPTVEGAYTFTVEVTDADASTAEVECSITVLPDFAANTLDYWNPGTSESLLCERNYPWIIPPALTIPVRLSGSLPAPAVNITTLLFEYTVPDGFWFVFDRLTFIATVAGYVDGKGSLFFVLDVNREIGVLNPLYRPIAKFTTQVGDLTEPVPVAPVQLYQGDTLRAKVLVVDPTLGVGLPNVVHGIVEGWLFPHSRNV